MLDREIILFVIYKMACGASHKLLQSGGRRRRSRRRRRRTRRHMPWAGWARVAPGTHARTVMLRKCGKKCFLGPKKSFSLCQRNLQGKQQGIVCGVR